MADLNQQNVRIQVLVSRDTEHGTFTDALYFTPEEFQSLPEERIEELSTERVDNWIALIEQAPEE